MIIEPKSLEFYPWNLVVSMQRLEGSQAPVSGVLKTALGGSLDVGSMVVLVSHGNVCVTDGLWRVKVPSPGRWFPSL